MGREIILLILLIAAFSYTVTYPSKVFIEKGEKQYINIKINAGNDAGNYEIKIEPPSCLDVSEKTMDLGYLDSNEEREIFIPILSNCVSLQKMKVEVDGPDDKEIEILIVPFKEPEITLSRETIQYGVENSLFLRINFSGEKICIKGDFVGDNRLCSKNGEFNVKVFGDKKGVKTMEIEMEIYKNGFKYNINKTINLIVEEEKPKIDIRTPYISRKGKLEFSLCRNCMICIYSQDLVLDKTCSEDGIFQYEYLGYEEKVPVYFVLYRKSFGSWVPAGNGTIVLKAESPEEIEILYGGIENGKMKMYIVNPTYNEIRDVFAFAGRYQKYFDSISPHDYEIFEVPVGCYNVTVRFGDKEIEKEICERVGSKTPLILALLISIPVLIYILKRVKVI